MSQQRLYSHKITDFEYGSLLLAKRLGEFGVEAKEVSVDFHKMIARKNKVVSRLRAGVGFLLKRAKVNVINGTAGLLHPEGL